MREWRIELARGLAMNHFTFVVNDEPYSLWDQDPVRRTKEFLDSIDPGFFSYLAEAHAENLESAEHKRRVATASRMAYLHGLETFMTLVGAAVQAPQAPYAWVALAQTHLLRGVVERINTGDATLHTELTEWDRTWAGLAGRVFAYSGQANGWPETAESFGRAWRLLAGEFLDQNNQDEYNSLKHGFRIRSSGVRIAFGLEHQYGVAPPPEEMKSLGGSDSGSTFYVIERVGPDAQGNRSKRSRRRTVNWTPETMIRGLQVIDVSIRNIVTFLRIVHGTPPGTVQFMRLEGIDDLAALLKDSVGIRTATFDVDLDESQIPVTTKTELLEELARTFKKSDDSDDPAAPDGSPHGSP